MKSAVAVTAITFLMTSAVFAQVHIRESVTITPGAKSTQSIYDDPLNPKYPRVGGTITVSLISFDPDGFQGGYLDLGRRQLDKWIPCMHMVIL